MVLDCAVEREACPHNLAPTTSTTAQMALGDAASVALLMPAGSAPRTLPARIRAARWGAKLLTLVHVADLMRTEPRCRAWCPIRRAI